ncbi:hypothetical protein FB45DRAFT_1059935 [Roridomyces roridus]|uniref:Uncharacterized protein n=1 Tax=Roridomyces roridus TaxID=1738132 RepID=A0AAD7BPQ0_9AGAR|nr:hypothetical protein FB45DRAFT_1059935 [Roridomyces roridus]
MAFGNTGTAELCMSLPAALIVGAGSQSFEEVRMADYLASYRASGRPPPPVPEYPSDPSARAAQGLPPLFVPAPFPAAPSAPTTSTLFASPVAGGGSIFGGQASTSSSTSATAIRDPARLPVTQALAAPVPVPGEGPTSGPEGYASIVASPEYSHFSPEELRYYAYLRGTRQPPPGTPVFAFAAATVPSSSVTGRRLPIPENGEQFQTLTTREEYCDHSLEEHRLSFLRTGTELTSAQIIAAASGSTPSSGMGITMAPPVQAAPRPLFSGSIPPSQPAPSLFAPSQPAVQSPFSFGPTPTPQPVAPVGGGGGFSFGAPQQQQQPMFSLAPPAPVQQSPFGAPSTPAPATFGAPAQPQQPQQSIFGQPQAQPSVGSGGFSFGATPSATGGSGFSFGARRM